MRDIHHMRRRGFVLLTVTLVGALLFVSALMFVSLLTTESHVTKTDAYFKSALNLAETGLSNRLMDITQSIGTSTWAEWFRSGGHTFAAVDSSAVHGTYQVTVKVIGTPQKVGNEYQAEVQVTSEGRIYTPAVTAMEGSGDYAARRAVRLRTMATWMFVPAYNETTEDTIIPAKYEPTTFGIKYGIFTGGDLSITGSSQEIHGDVFSNGNVYIQKSSGLVNGKAFAVGTVTGGLPTGVRFAGQASTPFPEIDIPTMRRLFDAYVRGIYPYDGTVAGLTNTSHTQVGEINRAIYNVNVLLAATRLDPVTGLYELPPMAAITAGVASALIDPKAVYYFDGDVKLASSTDLSGTIVIDGKFFISGNIEVGTGGALANIIATGDVTKDTGCSAINGLVYTGGSFTGRGTADMNGALIVRKSVDMSGNFNLTYNSSLPPITVGATLVQEATVIPGETTYHPDVYRLDDFKQPVSGERMWQEVTDLH